MRGIDKNNIGDLFKVKLLTNRLWKNYHKEREGEKERQRGIEREKGRKKDREINIC